MKKKVITKGYSDGKIPITVLIEISESNLDFSHIEVECDFSEIEKILLKHLEQLQKSKDFSINSYQVGRGKEIKELPSYHPNHIRLRYFLARQYCPSELNDPFEKIELEISDIYSKFLKSLPPPFDVKN